MNPPNKSSNAPLSGLGVDHADSEPMSKLKALELDSAAGRAAAGGVASNAEEKDVNIGLLARVV